MEGIEKRGIVWIALLLSFFSLGAQQQDKDMTLENITQTVEVNGMTFPYYELGEGPVVLLLLGFPESNYLWRNQLQPLAEAGFRVIAPDLRGFGDAPRPEKVSAYAIPELLADVTGLLDALGVEKAHVVGHDWGGTLAWLFAGNFPERSLSVTGLTVGAPGSPGRRTLDQLEKMWYIFFFQNEGPAEEWLQRDDWQGLRKWTREKGDWEHNIRLLEREGALTAGLNWYRANFSPASLNSKSNPPRIQVPAMGISAENDAYLLEAHVKNSDAMIDSSWTYHRMPDASHWLMLDHPDQLNAWLIDFFREVGAD
jgi:pimeloyl-ACP methyl ester carboxylesterase